MPEGKTIALCGSSGSGKSTVVNLILRFYDSVKGTVGLISSLSKFIYFCDNIYKFISALLNTNFIIQVKIGGFDVKSLNVHWLRTKIGLVSQEPILFSGSIAKNIEYGYQGVTFQNIVAAAKMANAHHFISQLPMVNLIIITV